MRNIYDVTLKELEDYLETYKSLYDNYTSSSSKRINKRLVSLIFIISIFMALLSIPFLATHTALGFIGVSLDVISFPIIGIGINLLIKEHDEEKILLEDIRNIVIGIEFVLGKIKRIILLLSIVLLQKIELVRMI